MKLQNVITNVEKLESAGRQIIKLHTADPDIPCDPGIIRIIKKFSNKHRYCNTAGLLKLREMLAEKYGVATNNVLIGCGSRHLLFGLLLSVKQKWIVIPDPEWACDLPLQSLQLKINRVNWLFNEPEETFINKLVGKICPSIKYIILSNPNNPTGRTLSRNSISSITQSCEQSNCYLVEDRAYESLSFKPMSNEVKVDSHIIVGTFSKGFSMTGYRVGYLISLDKRLITEMENYIYNSVQCLPTCIQEGTCEALKRESEIREKVQQIYHGRLITAEQILKATRIEYMQPQSYPFIYINTGDQDCEVITEKLLERGIAVAPSTAFSRRNDFIRVSLMADEKNISTAMNIIIEILRKE